MLADEHDVIGRGYMDSLKPIEGLDAPIIGKFLKYLHNIIAHVSYNLAMLTMTYEYKLEPTAEQIESIEQTLDICRSVWNFALRQRKDWCASRKSPINACSIQSEYIISADEPFPNYHKQAKQLTQAKKLYPHLKTVHSQVLQQTLRTLDRAWDDMKARGFGWPRFKNKYRMRSFVFPQLGKDPIRDDGIKFPKLGWVKWRQSRPIPFGFQVKQARIVRKASGYFVMLSLQLNVNVSSPMPHGHPRGLDLGFDTDGFNFRGNLGNRVLKFVATSDGEEIKRPRFLITLQRKLKLLQRRLKNKQKGSNNRYKLNQKIARLHQRISDTRKDWHFKLAHHLCDGAGMIFVVGEACPKAHTGKKTLDIRFHHCDECGYRTTRDVAASQVLRNRGLNAVGQTVVENVCGLEATGSIGHDTLVGTGRSRKPNSRELGIPSLKVTEHREVA
ncbi:MULTISPECIES: transposase [Moorena]|nr:transposase [Moorena producens]